MNIQIPIDIAWIVTEYVDCQDTPVLVSSFWIINENVCVLSVYEGRSLPMCYSKGKGWIIVALNVNK